MSDFLHLRPLRSSKPGLRCTRFRHFPSGVHPGPAPEGLVPCRARCAGSPSSCPSPWRKSATCLQERRGAEEAMNSTATVRGLGLAALATGGCHDVRAGGMRHLPGRLQNVAPKPDTPAKATPREGHDSPWLISRAAADDG